MQKLYCYIDETGQDTIGDFFLVAAVVVGTERDDVEKTLEAIEQKSGKGKSKWIKSRHAAKHAYIEAVLTQSLLQERICYAVYRNSKDYLRHTAQTTHLAIAKYAKEDYKATIIVDGLQEGNQEKEFRNLIREYGVRLWSYKKTPVFRGIAPIPFGNPPVRAVIG